MRLAYDHQIFALQVYGGISRYFWEIATRLAEWKGYEVRVCAPVFINRYLRRDCGVTVRGTCVPYIQRTGRIVSGVSRLWSRRCLAKWRPDIVHETYYRTTRDAPSGAKTVVTIHDMIHEKFPQYFLPGDETTSAKRAAVKRADHVICVSENTRRDLLEVMELMPERVSVVYHGASVETGEAGAGRKLIGQPYILYVGERAGYKNFEGAATAYARSARLRGAYSLVCVGGGAFSAQEVAMLAGLGLSEGQVRQVSTGDAGLHSLYRDAAVLVYPSLYEGFGMPPLEAMANGCPVVCSETGALREVCGDAAAYFDANEVESIGAVIEQVLYSTAERPSRVARGRQRAGMFSWEKCAADTERVYNTVVGMN